MKGKWSPMLCVLLTAVVCQTAIRIEWYNWRAGGILPRKKNAELGYTTTWRVAVPDAWWKHSKHAYLAEFRQIESQSPEESGYTTEEVTKIRKDLSEIILRELVGTWGVVQYFLAPLSLLWALCLVARSKRPMLRKERRILRMGGSALAVVSLVCIALMLYRRYFTSLG